MAKRKVIFHDDSDCDDAYLPSDVDQSDYEPEAQPALKRRKNNVGPKKTTKTTVETITSDPTSLHHAKGVHSIKQSAEIRIAVLQWYSGVHAMRGMPWRKPFNIELNKAERSQRAYEIMVSEIMLQQTQVATVIPYYNTWMRKFPTIQSLAESTIDAVNAVWKGLGYYSRASRLLAAAQKVVREYDGLLPDNAKDMEAKIPGIGRYSAGAICSIAYGERVPVLDGNVHRLLSRLLALHAPPKSKATLDILWQAAGDLVRELPPKSGSGGTDPMVIAQNPGDINQALIELGSTVCKVRDPNCGTCPLRPWCSAYELSQKARQTDLSDIEDLCTLCEPIDGARHVTAYPMKVEKKKARKELDIVNVVEWRPEGNDNDRQILLVKRPDTGLLAGLFEFPAIENVSKTVSNEELNDMLLRQLSHLLSSAVLPEHSDPTSSSLSGALRIKSVCAVGDVSHVFSHIKKTYRVRWILLEGGSNPPELNTPARPTRANAKAHLPTHVSFNPIWTPGDDVVNSNIGTGVLKIWKKVKNLWEKT